MRLLSAVYRTRSIPALRTARLIPTTYLPALRAMSTTAAGSTGPSSGTGVLVVLIAAPPAASDALARALVESRTAACVNRLPGVRSTYRWQGAVEVDDEEMLVVKTTDAQYAALEALVKDKHPYDVPEIIATRVETGSEAYLAWVRENVGPAAAS